jgi:uncharacterized protein
MHRLSLSIGLLMVTAAVACNQPAKSQQSPDSQSTEVKIASTTVRKVVESAITQHSQTLTYDPSYEAIPYPNGDVPIERGVCADVIIRAFRAAGVDLQQSLHEDMRGNFSAYPKDWGARAPDPNIDHRRVANLMKYFKRKDADLAITSSARDYQPGDVVAWRLGNGRLHIGIVTNRQIEGTDRFLVSHNIGRGVQIEDVLFAWEVIGHYRYFE